MKGDRLNEQQRLALLTLKRWIGEGFIPSSHLRNRGVLNPGPLLARLAKRGLVEAGAVMPEGKCYRITGKGLEALGYFIVARNGENRDA